MADFTKFSKEKEKELINKAVTGDVAAFETLTKHYYHSLFMFAISITGGNRDYASDVLQEALIKAYLYIKSFKGNSSFKTWLWRIVRNEFYNYLKKNSPSSMVSIDDSEYMHPKVAEDSEATILLDERKMNLRKLMGQLSQMDQEILNKKAG